jgi:glutamate-1-semialdehyde 2,1-aminomutase
MESPRDARLHAGVVEIVSSGRYGHMNDAALHPELHQFFPQHQGARVGGCGVRLYPVYAYGPNVLGHQHPAVEQAAGVQRTKDDCIRGPSPPVPELPSRTNLSVTPCPSAWTVFAHNGMDAATSCFGIARLAGERRARPAHGWCHGAAPHCTPHAVGVPLRLREPDVPHGLRASGRCNRPRSLPTAT